MGDPLIERQRNLLRRRHTSGQRGQMTVEFVFAMVFLLVFVAAMMQALMFELDVFNRLGEGRKAAMDRAHRDQDETEKDYFEETIQFTPVDDLGVELSLGRWQLTEGLQYGDKNYFAREGTKFYEPAIPGVDIPILRHSFTLFLASIMLGHHESMKSYWVQLPDIHPGLPLLYPLDPADIEDGAELLGMF